MEIFIHLLGINGVYSVLGLTTFLFCYRYSTGIFDWIEHQTMGTREYILEKLDLLFIEIKPTNITYLLLVCSVGLGCLISLIFTFLGKWEVGIILGVFIAFIGFKIPRLVINILIERRIKNYQGQMVDGLQLLANGIRAGLSVPQAVGMVVAELPAPISQEFNVILQQNKIGVSLEDCFENLVKRIPTEDNEMFVSSMNILRESGGNLAEVFDTIVDVIRERIRLQQKIDTFIAQGMFQGITLFSMPFVIGGVFMAMDPAMMKTMVTTPLGWVLLAGALILDMIGGYFIIKITKIKV